MFQCAHICQFTCLILVFLFLICSLATDTGVMKYSGLFCSQIGMGIYSQIGMEFFSKLANISSMKFSAN